MFRHLGAWLLVPAALFLLSPASAEAQGGRPMPDPWAGEELTGAYTNTSNGGECEVYRSRQGYTFVNERGSRAQFVSVGRGRLEWAGGGWDPNIVATVSQDRRGRTTIRFDSPRGRPGYWVSADFRAEGVDPRRLERRPDPSR
jgi:hypothetical protein